MRNLFDKMDKVEIWVMIVFCAVAYIFAHILQGYLNKKKEKRDARIR